MQQVGGASAPLAVPEDVLFVPTPGAHITAAEAEAYGSELYRLNKVERVELILQPLVSSLLPLLTCFDELLVAFRVLLP